MNDQDVRIARGQSIWKKWWVYSLGLLALTLVAFALFRSQPPRAEVGVLDFLADARAGQVERVDLDSDGRHFSYRVRDDHTRYEVEKYEIVSVAQILLYGGLSDEQRAGIDIRDEPALFDKALSALTELLPAALVIGLLVILIRRTGLSTAAVTP